jgi:hypothetical protein
MNDVRDEVLGGLLDRAAGTIGMQPVERLSDVLRRGSRRRAVRFVVIGAAIAVFAGAVSWAGLSLPSDEAAIPANVADWRTFGSLEEDGWTAQVPPSWRVQGFGPCWGQHLRLLGAIVTNVDFDFRNRRGELAGCSEAYVWAGFPRDGVAFAFQPYPAFGIVQRHPVTQFPLTPDALSKTGAVRGGPSETYVIIKIPGEFYPIALVRRWVGPEASPTDVAALDRLLGSLQVRGAARWTETAGTTDTLHDEQRGYTVTYPDGWTVANENLTPQLAAPAEILSLGTFPLRAGQNIDDGLRLFDAPVAPKALEDMTSVDAFVSLQESGSDVDLFDGRPERFGPLGCEDAIFGCRAENWNDVPLRAWWIPFRDQGRAFYLFVAIGNEATPALEGQTWAVADSLTFEPAAP